LTLKKSTIPNLVSLQRLVKDFRGLFSLPMALCTGDCASKKFFLFR
jgi:hypothetical protein